MSISVNATSTSFAGPTWGRDRARISTLSLHGFPSGCSPSSHLLAKSSIRAAGSVPWSGGTGRASLCRRLGHRRSRIFRHQSLRFSDDLRTNLQFRRQSTLQHRPALRAARSRACPAQGRDCFPDRAAHNAARWLEQTPLARIWLLTPRPSMPPGEAILRGEKPAGGKVDFCWLVFEVGYYGKSIVRWLQRDGATTFEQLLDKLAGKK